MSDPGELTQQSQMAELWDGLQQFATLPEWLAAARDPSRVCSALAQVVPEFASGRLILERCEIGHMRFKVQIWSGIYELFVRGPGDVETRILPLEGTIFPPGYPVSGPTSAPGNLGSQGWRVYLPELNLELASPEPEKVLSSLALLTDPQEARSFLEQSIRDNPAYREFSLQACNPRVVRYKPGSRCTILYDVEYGLHSAPDGRWPDLIVAKTYRSEKGQNAYESMRALWDSPLASSGAVTIAEPLAYSPEMRVLLQGPIREEQTLKNLISWAAFTDTTEALGMAGDWLRKTGFGLAALHASGVRSGRIWTWEDELAEVRERIDRLAEPIPGIAHAADPLLERLREMAQVVPPDPLVPSHGSFRPAQVLLYQGQIGFIDFDSFCQSEPALDLALFLITVQSIGLDTSDYQGDKSAPPLEGAALTRRLEQMLALSDVFLDEYEQSLPVSRQRVALWAALDFTMLVLASWIKIKTFRLQDCIFLLENHLRRMGI